MPKDNRHFFESKKLWSEVKDELLGCYLVPYFSKLLATHKPILYVDCFAGKGKFDDGNDGSPLIALKAITECNQHTRFSGKISPYFIELNHAFDLRANTAQFDNVNVIDGSFEDNIINILRKHPDWTVFLYIDPYGIKALNAEFFDSIGKNFKRAELLINLNSFGFIREACRALGVEFREQEKEILGDLEEYETSVMQKSDKSISDLDTIAGGDFWKTIIINYQQKNIGCYEAEKIFSAMYRQRLSQQYCYVLDMPIRLKEGNLPKYRMIHATDHPDGCILMADNIAKRVGRLFVEIQNVGQNSLFEQSAENELIDDSALADHLTKYICVINKFIRLNEFLAGFYVEYGVLCSKSKLIKILKSKEKEGIIEVSRQPKMTTKGKPSAFWTENTTKKLFLRSKPR